MSEYEEDKPVGYGNPPKRTRFKPGQSGNPKGRPKGSKSLGRLLDKELCEKVTIREGATTRKITKKEALVKRLVKDAADGKSSAMRDLMALIQAGEMNAEAEQSRDRLSPTAQKLVGELLDRAKRNGDEHEG